MLAERKELIENEIRKLHTEAASMYLEMIKSGKTRNTVEYEEVKEKISSYEFDLNVINLLMK